MTRTPGKARFFDPPLWRVIIAFLVSPATIIGPFALLLWVSEQQLSNPGVRFSEYLFVTLFVFVYPTVTLIGVPTYIIFRKKLGVDIGNIIIWVTSVSLGTWAAILVFGGISSIVNGQGYTIIEVVGIVLGMFVVTVIPVGLLGFFSGCVFGLILNVGRKPPLAGARDPA